MDKIWKIIHSFWPLLLVGLVLRLILAATTFHLDVKAQMVASAGYFNGDWDVYAYARSIHPDTVLDKLPMSYFLDFPLRLPLHFLENNAKEKIFLLSPDKLFGDPWLFGYLIYAKLPFILIDIMVGILLALNVLSQKQKQVLIFWMFNPVTLWASAMIGQIDIYIAFFILLALSFVKKSKYNWAAFILGIGGAVKSAPFLLVPLLLGMVDSWKKRIGLILLSILPYCISIFPYLSSPTFRHDALLAPQLSKMLYAKLDLSRGEAIFITMVLTAFLYLQFINKKRNTDDFLKYSISIFLVILALTHFHIQWSIWVMPLLILWLVDHFENDIRLALGFLFLGLLMMLFLFEGALQVRLFAPLFPSLDQALGLKEILSDQQVIFWRSIAASIFAGSSGFLIWRILRD